MKTIDSIDLSAHAQGLTNGSDPRRLLLTRIVAILGELADLVAALPSDGLSRSGGPVFQNASIGQHLRHTLDHVRTVADMNGAGTLDYDARDRGTSIESDRTAAMAEMARLVAKLSVGPSGDTPLLLDAIATPDGERVVVSTSYARELVFLLSHTVHHASTIRSIAASFGVAAPESLGLAPATHAHRKGSSSCAR